MRKSFRKKWCAIWYSGGNVWKRSKSNLPVRSLNIMMSIIESMHNNLAGWAGQNGQSSGTSGFGFQLEAIQIKLVKRWKAPGTTNNGFRDGRKKYVDKRGKGLIKGSNKRFITCRAVNTMKTTSPIRMFKTEVEAYKAFDQLNRERLSQCVQ